MYEGANLRKPVYLRHQRYGLSPRQPTQACIHENIFDAGEFHVESGPEFQQGSDPPAMPHIPVCRFQCAGDELKKGEFAAAIRTDYPFLRTPLTLQFEGAYRPK